MAKQTIEKVYVEIYIQVEGSEVQNRLTVCEVPIVGRAHGSDEENGAVQFETKNLVREMKNALDRLL